MTILPSLDLCDIPNANCPQEKKEAGYLHSANFLFVRVCFELGFNQRHTMQYLVVYGKLHFQISLVVTSFSNLCSHKLQILSEAKIKTV